MSLEVSLEMHIGLDAGGSTTELLARSSADGSADGEELHLHGPGANPQRVGTEQAARVLTDLIREALRRCPSASLAGMCAGVAGVDGEADRQALEGRLRRVLGGGAPAHVRIVHDTAIAFEAAFGAGSGLIVIAGTGSVACARTREGALRRAGGWGYAVGDEGSGYALGCAGLRAVAHAFDGGPPTCLRQLIAERYGLGTREAVIRSVYQAKWPLQKAAALVLEAAAAGDAVAGRILDEQTTLLARQVAWLAGRCPSIEPRIALFGGLTKETPYTQALHRALKDHLPDWPAAPASDPPVAGALRLALPTCRDD